ncbi:hypothetical protein AADG42_19160 [Ammonicoccus fulvus]|uniref:Uncharacterized protein n=1 Tax=Ammonicoccus fulvus TaxID=3138240 RepID=A0ABZ3FX98_9ACTN
MIKPIVVAGRGDPTPTVSSTPAATHSPTVTRTPSASPKPTATPKPSFSPVPNTRTVSVPDMESRTVKGEGDMDIAFTIDGDFAMAADLDCRKCEGQVFLNSVVGERNSSWANGQAPLEGSYLLTISRSDRSGVAQIRTKGSWEIRFYDWGLARQVTGKQQGDGSTVFAMMDEGTRIRYRFEPAYPGASINIRAAAFAPKTGFKVFGTDEAGEAVVDVELPAVVAITANGRWELSVE